jgi:hypothetical protein
MCQKSGVTGREAMKDKNIISTQIRLPVGIHEYIKQEAERMGIA